MNGKIKLVKSKEEERGRKKTEANDLFEAFEALHHILVRSDFVAK